MRTAGGPKYGPDEPRLRQQSGGNNQAPSQGVRDSDASTARIEAMQGTAVIGLEADAALLVHASI
jgi:hypothetical protein